MFDTFKNTELFRYFIRVDLNKNIDKIIEQNKSNFSLVAGSIFSGLFSVLGTYFGLHDSKYNSLKQIIFSTLLFIVLFLIGIVLFQVGNYLFQYIKNSMKKEGLPSKAKIKEYIDDFDHIACDNILISQNFIDAFNDTDCSKHLKEFYFYEIMYYTKVSSTIIQKLFTYKNECINDKCNTTRVHLYRIKNALSMLDDINHFLCINKKEIAIDKSMAPSLDDELKELDGQIDTLKNSYEKLKAEKYPLKS